MNIQNSVVNFFSFSHFLLCIFILSVYCSLNVSAASDIEHKSEGTKVNPRSDLRTYCEWSTECGVYEICHNGYCEDFGYNDAVGVAVGVYVAIAIGIPLLISLIIVLSCLFCSGCPLNNYRNRRREVAAQRFIVHQGQTNIAYDQQGRPVIIAPSQPVYGIPNNGQPGWNYPAATSQQNQQSNNPPPPYYK